LRGAACAWIAPTYKNSRPLWRFIESAIAPIASELQINRAEREIQIPTGGRLAIYSADSPDSIRGEAFDIVVIDEAARIAEETWLDAIQPTLADRDGHAMLISTPKGLNWFANEWKTARADLTGYSAAWHAPSNSNPMPTIRRAFDLARERVPERTFRQEWLAEFVEGGTLFRNVRECATAQPREPQSGHSYAIGVDWARSADFSVFCVVDIAEQRIAHLDRFTGVDYPTQAMRLDALHKRYNGAQIIAETNAMGAPMVELLQQRGLPVTPFTTTAATKNQAIDALIRAFEYREIAILNDPTLIAELESYEELRRSVQGVPSYGAPDGMHDDCVMALAFAWSALTRPTWYVMEL
jgi:phage terminase large subunit-like protein